MSEPDIILDLSRLLSRVLHPTPTGVDRCEMAYARQLQEIAPGRLRFAAVHPTGAFGRLRSGAVHRFLDMTEERWDHKGYRSHWEMRRFAISALANLYPYRTHSNVSNTRPFYIQASPSNLNKPKTISSILKREQANFICLVHDLIPLEYPEYARPGGAREHEIRVRSILNNARGVVCNSQATLSALKPWMIRLRASPATEVAHLGIHFSQVSDPPQRALDLIGERPYFVCIGTIEPRKNHLLLLNIWRQMSEQFGAESIPKLIIVGRRGWENEQIVDMLERCPALRGCVEEHGRLTDRNVADMLPHACALLMPSFAEGYGMPVAEALALNVPVVCSDLPALREAGGGVPHFLNPLDGPAWLAAIRDLTMDGSRIRAEQADRRSSWVPQTWSAHLSKVGHLIEKIRSGDS